MSFNPRIFVVMGEVSHFIGDGRIEEVLNIVDVINWIKRKKFHPLEESLKREQFLIYERIFAYFLWQNENFGYHSIFGIKKIVQRE